MPSKNPITLLGTPKSLEYYQGDNLKDETMENQQVTPEELGWLAGIIDGEGYLGINYQKDKRRKKGSYTSLTPCLHISNTDEEIILKSQNIVRKLGVNPYIRATKGKNLNSKDQYRIQIKNMAKMKIILNAMLPHLTGIKQERARLVLEFIEIRKSAPWKWIRPDNATNQSGAIKPYSEKEWEIYRKCKAIQSRGKTSETTHRAQRLTSEIWNLMKSRQQGVVKV